MYSLEGPRGIVSCLNSTHTNKQNQYKIKNVEPAPTRLCLYCWISCTASSKTYLSIFFYAEWQNLTINIRQFLSYFIIHKKLAIKLWMA